MFKQIFDESGHIAHYNMMMGITSDLENVQFDAEAIQEKLGNPENLALLKDILTKLG